MNWLDLAVIAVVVLSAVFAFARGFVREALSIVAWVGAAAITLYGFKWAFALVDPHLHNPLLSQVIAGFGLFVASLVVLTIATGLVARMVHASGLTPIDRTLGFIFGVARGAFLVCVAYLLLDLSVPPPAQPEWIRDAKSAPYLHEGADLLKGFLPDALKGKSADDVIKALTPAELTKQAIGANENPAPARNAQPNAAPAAPSYPAKDRQQLDRVIGIQR
jgi:membrane protein required for colicin V production